MFCLKLSVFVTKNEIGDGTKSQSRLPVKNICSFLPLMRLEIVEVSLKISSGFKLKLTSLHCKIEIQESQETHFHVISFLDF